MKIMLWSDLHLHRWKPFSTITNNGMNSRLIDGIEVIYELNQICLEEEIEYRLFLGDLFHKRDEVYVPAVLMALDAFWRGKLLCGVEDYLLVGNHDQALNIEFNVLGLFKGVCNVIEGPGAFHSIKDTGVSFTAHPWNDDRMKWRENYIDIMEHLDRVPSFSITHYDFKDVSYRGLTIGEGAATSLLRTDIPTYSGHYHDYGDYGKLIYVGSPMQHNLGDIGYKRGYVILDIKEGKVIKSTFHELKTTPVFKEFKVDIEFNISPKPKKLRRGYFAKVLVPEGSDNTFRKTVEEKMLKLGARSVMITSSEIEKSMEEEHDFDYQGEDLSSIVTAYVKDIETDLNKSKLRRYGKILLEGT